MSKKNLKKTAAANQKSANQMWGGHYASGPSEVMARINNGLDADKRLYREDIMGSIAHADMLAATGIISAKDAAAIKTGLAKILKEIESGRFSFSEELEDIHMNIEARLKDLIGDTAGRLHTARSRNDQVATDLRLWVRSAIDRADAGLAELQVALLAQAEAHAETIMPGYTHLQPAQPVTFGHHLMAYIEMFTRDRSRLMDARSRLNESPLGAAALAGTSYPIDRHMTAKALGFRAPMANSLDAVSDRDFALEFVNAAALAAVHLSRLAEEIILWASSAFGFIMLPESFTTGSSIMPQKRNPDAAELIRGKTAAIMGAQTQLYALMKGLPLAYNKDLQESKMPVILAADELELMLAAMAGMLRGLRPNVDAMRAATQKGFLTATDLADYLVQRYGMPFREAHHVTGKIVRMAEAKQCRLDELPLADMRKVFTKLDAKIFDVLNTENAVRRRASYGGTAPIQVKAQIKTWKKKLY